MLDQQRRKEAYGNELRGMECSIEQIRAIS